MSDLLRLILLLVLAGAAVTVAGSGYAWWSDEERRLRRYIRRSLKGSVDAVIVAKGRAAGAGFSLAYGEAVVMWRGGASALLYPLRAFLGAELIVDERVAARVFRGEARRALDVIDRGARTVTLRLIFDNPRDPDFDLDLWLPQDALRHDAKSAGEAIQQARSWLARVESLLRLPPAEAAIAPDPHIARDPPPPWEDDPDDELYAPDEPDLFREKE